MADFIGLAIQLAFLLSFLGLGYFIGGSIERRHLKNLQVREEQTRHVLVTQLKSFPQVNVSELAPRLFVSEVVISSDYLKSFLALFRNLVGGEVRSFQTLLDRARREAVLRLKEESLQEGFNAICNVRLETADIGGRGTNGKNKVMMASILASGTAYSTSQPAIP